MAPRHNSVSPHIPAPFLAHATIPLAPPAISLLFPQPSVRARGRREFLLSHVPIPYPPSPLPPPPSFPFPAISLS
jgi:hypothetical protein